MAISNKKKMKISVIIPTCNRYKTLLENIEILRDQKHYAEIIVCDDTHIDQVKENEKLLNLIKEKADKYCYSAVYDYSGKKLYGLGRARNYGVIESTGEALVFLDDRIAPANNNLINVFVNKLKQCGPKVWLFGEKGANKKSFVENCSCCRRKELITSGMFPETINSYGFMTREIYARHVRQGWKFIYVPDALAKPIRTGSRRNDPERQKQIDYSKDILKRMSLI
jgi:glycosyltransferase involved in cell wall biosynthesis